MDIKQNIIGILAGTESSFKFAGTGFFVEGGIILTCAHVVGKDKKRGDAIFFQFEGQDAVRSATIDYYSSEDDLDIAVLKPDSLPKGVTPLPLAFAESSRGHKFSVFGYPQKGRYNGLYGAGEILGLVDDKKGRKALQLSSPQVTYGYSGGPILDEICQIVVGMVRGGLEQDLNLSEKLGDAAFAIPTETLKTAYPTLKLKKNKGSKLPPEKKYDEEIVGNTIIKEGRNVQIIISQMFRMADLLTSPDGVKAKKLYEIATDPEKCRRFLNLDRNGKKKKIPIEPYGYLTPVAVINDHVESLWRYAKKDFREGDDPLRFFPLELDLTEYLRKLGPISHAMLDNNKKGGEQSVLNLQLSGGLRIYPPGTGIVRFSLTIEFRHGIEIETMATLARKIDSLLFVNPDGNESDFPTVFMEIVDTVAQNIFLKERYEGKELRWQPPETTFCFRDYKSAIVDDKIRDLARLMSYAPENYEKLDALQKRLERAIQDSQWQKNRLLFAVGQGVVLLLAGETNQKTPRELKNLFDRLIDTRELISAAGYAEKAFAERVSDEYSAYRIHKKFNLENLNNLLFTMQRVLYATYSIRGHLKSTGRGELMSFAQSLWAYDNPVDYKELKHELSAILDFLTTENFTDDSHVWAEEIKTAITQILELPHPFPVKKDSKHFG
jgi:hypothetical protein